MYCAADGLITSLTGAIVDQNGGCLPMIPASSQKSWKGLDGYFIISWSVIFGSIKGIRSLVISIELT